MLKQRGLAAPPGPPSRLQDENSYVTQLRTCKTAMEVKLVHDLIVRDGIGLKTYIGNSLMKAYAQFGMISAAEEIFSSISKNIYSWNTMISAYVRNNQPDKALNLFTKMQQSGDVIPNEITLLPMIGAASRSYLDAQAIQEKVDELGMNNHHQVGGALIKMYGTLGMLDSAVKAFHSVAHKDEVCWTAIISACSQNAKPLKALQFFDSMDIDPTEVTLVTILQACGSIGALSRGSEIHARLIRMNLDSDVFVGTALVTMCGGCGRLEAAKDAFSKIRTKTVAAYNALLSVCVRNGREDEVEAIRNEMRKQSIAPNAITYISLLSESVRRQNVEQGLRLWTDMKQQGISPQTPHYVCLVQLLGRANRLEQAELIIEEQVDHSSSASCWIALLEACKMHLDIQRALRAMARIVKLQPTNAAPYIILANMYISAGKADKAQAVIQALESSPQAQKEKGESTIEVEGQLHLFSAKSSLSQNEVDIQLIAMVRKLQDGAQYSIDTRFIHHGSTQGEKQILVICHSEKQAIAFGICNSDPESLLYVFNTHNICSDCHTFAQAVSRVYRRSIIIKDASFHFIKDGKCSCNNV